MNRLRITKHQGSNAVENVLYLMTKAHRMNDNHSLEYAMSVTKEHLMIAIVRQQEEHPRNNQFFEEGIKNYKEVLGQVANDVSLHYGITDSLIERVNYVDMIVIDESYLLEDQKIMTQVKSVLRPEQVLVSVETNVIVPTKVASNKEEYSARTIRPKLWKQLDAFRDINTNFTLLFPYEKEALEVLKFFVESKLAKYEFKNDPSQELTSKLSVYLKYGFISPLTIYNYVEGVPFDITSFIEELFIRRELAYNFIQYNKGYNQFQHMTYEWAHLTMEQHLYDHRDYIYDIDDYIHFQTHDIYFNAAMKEMVKTGYMHGYMRMYWCKKIIEWSRTYQEAYDIALKLNNYYFLDGNTPNGYTGVAWCFGKHDRAWTERMIFGKLRYMNDNGLKRKFDIERYVTRKEEL